MQVKFWKTGRVVLGLLTGAVCAFPQAYTISAKPGAVNYIEGPASVNGTPITANAKRVFVGSNDSLETASGSKAEMLLTPGVFVRLGSASSVKMISPSLVDTRVEVTRGEVVVEVAEFEKENNITVVDHGVETKILKPGLYRFTAEPAVAQVLSGKATVVAGDRRVEVGKDHEMALAEDMKPQKFSSKTAEDDLYAWSKVRDEYVAAASYSAAKNVGMGNSMTGFDPYGGIGYSGYGGYGGYGGYSGFGGYYGPGWFWNSGWNSWAWLPGDGAFFSPFGFGYYSPLYAGYAPVAYLPVNGTRPVAVPINPGKPVTIGGVTARPMMPSGRAVNAESWGRIPSGGGHVTSAMISHSAASASASRGGGGGGGGYYSGGGARASAPAASAPMGGGMHGGGSAPASHK